MRQIKEWFMGLCIAIFGSMVCFVSIALVVNFICMMNSTGKEFVEYFVNFIIDLIGFVFLPYIFFKILETEDNKHK